MEDIPAVVGYIICNATGKAEISNKVVAQKLSERYEFIEVVETKLLVLNEDDFIRYRIKPSDFSACKMYWDS